MHQLSEQSVRMTFKDKRNPTAEQERVMEFGLRRCRERCKRALAERRDAWRTFRVSVTMAGRYTALPAVKAARPDYRGIHSLRSQDVLMRLDRAVQAYDCCLKPGATPGSPRSRGVNR